MADSSDVEFALLAYVSSVLLQLPLATSLGVLIVTGQGVQITTSAGGGYQLGTIASGPTGPLRLLRGWPSSTALATDVPGPSRSATPPVPVANVSVQIDPGMSRNTTRYLTRPAVIAAPVPTLLLRSNGNLVTINGTCASGQVAGLLVGAQGNALSAAYRLNATDTTTSVAAALAALIPGASSAGPVITLPDDKVTCRVGQDAVTIVETRRQEATFRIVVYAATPDDRDKIARSLDEALAQVSLVGLPDGTCCYVRYSRTISMDNSAQTSVWRRDLLYVVEYPTIITTSYPEMLFGVLGSLSNVASAPLTMGGGPVAPLAPAVATTTDVLAAALATDTAQRIAFGTFVEAQIAALPPPNAGGATTYTFNNATPTRVWRIAHNLGRFPDVTVVDSAGSQVEGDVTYQYSNTLTVTFTSAFAGVAYLN